MWVIRAIIVAFDCHPQQCAAWASTLITHKPSPIKQENQGKQKQKGNPYTHTYAKTWNLYLVFTHQVYIYVKTYQRVTLSLADRNFGKNDTQVPGCRKKAERNGLSRERRAGGAPSITALGWLGTDGSPITKTRLAMMRTVYHYVGCLRYTKLCWVGKHVNIIMKPTNSPT